MGKNYMLKSQRNKAFPGSFFFQMYSIKKNCFTIYIEL